MFFRYSVFQAEKRARRGSRGRSCPAEGWPRAPPASISSPIMVPNLTGGALARRTSLAPASSGLCLTSNLTACLLPALLDLLVPVASTAAGIRICRRAESRYQLGTETNVGSRQFRWLHVKILNEKRDVVKSSVTWCTVENKMMSAVEHALQLALLVFAWIPNTCHCESFQGQNYPLKLRWHRSHLPDKVYVQNQIALIILLG